MTITETVVDSRREIDRGLIGSVHYRFTSPTHWSEVCTVVLEVSPFAPSRIRLDYGSGGWNKGFTSAQIADALSKAFALAANRINQLQEEIENETA